MLGAILALATGAQGQANRTFVSTTGSDTNVSVYCGPTTPCRTFNTALSVTNSGGEVVVLTSGGYGAATITKPVTISAVGVAASITATTGNAITLNTFGNVTISGLRLYGNGLNTNGIVINQAGLLRLRDVTVQNFATGLSVPNGAQVAIYDSRFSENLDGLDGLGGDVHVQNTSFEHNYGNGIFQNSGTIVVADSNADHNDTGIESIGGILSLVRDEIVLNGTGLYVTRTGIVSLTVQILSCLIAQNSADAYVVNESNILSGSNPGTSAIIGTTSGPVAPAVTLQ